MSDPADVPSPATSTWECLAATGMQQDPSTCTKRHDGRNSADARALANINPHQQCLQTLCSDILCKLWNASFLEDLWWYGEPLLPSLLCSFDEDCSTSSRQSRTRGYAAYESRSCAERLGFRGMWLWAWPSASAFRQHLRPPPLTPQCR